MIISLIHPSRGRPEKAKQTYDHWMSKASGKIEIEHILSLDFSDPKNEDYGMDNEGKYLPFGDNSKVIIDHNTCVVEATNQAAQVSKGDILIYMSDDFKCPQDWDLSIVEKFTGVEDPMLLKVDDLLQPFDKDVLTIPIMNRYLYEGLKYFFNPIYLSMYVDQDLYWVCHNCQWIKYAPELKFEHEHYSVGKAPIDETYIKSDLNWNQGKEVYLKRKQEGFKL